MTPLGSCRLEFRRVFQAIVGAMLLFAPNLRAGAAPPQPGVPAWRLAGTVLGPDRREALFARTGETRTAAEGEQLDGWTVASVQAGGAVLTRAGARVALSLQGLSLAEANAAQTEAAAQALSDARQRADEAAQTALDDQARQEDAAHTALVEATRRMQAQ